MAIDESQGKISKVFLAALTVTPGIDPSPGVNQCNQTLGSRANRHQQETCVQTSPTSPLGAASTALGGQWQGFPQG